jgi:serine/threonine protein kinase
MLAELEDKYEILEKVSEGGMGTVYKVRHRLLDEIRVIKVIRRELQNDEQLRTRFLREARVAIQLRHPHIAQLYDCAIAADGSPFMVMEFVDGQPLDDLLKSRGSPPLAVTLVIARQALEAIGYLHRQGFVHRDISLDNLMLARDRDGRPLVKLIDLGIAKSMESDAAGITATGMYLGKIKYSSPEQFKGAAVDHRSDLYSFAVALYELLTGRLPFEGGTFSELVAGHLLQPPIAFDESDPAGRVPEELRRIVLQALAKEPADRPGDAEDLSRALAEVERDFPLSDDLLRQVFATGDRVPESGKGIRIEETTAERSLIVTGETELGAAPPRREAPSTDVRLRSGGVTLLSHPGSSAVEVDPGAGGVSAAAGGFTVIFRPEMEAVLASANDHLVEDWLRMQTSERIGSILSSETSARLLLTGYGSFGGTSLVRGVTARLMQNVARRDRGKVLVVRLETSRAPAGTYDLFINETRAGSIDDQMDEIRLASIVADTLAEPVLSGAAMAPHDTFQGLTAIFDHGSGSRRTSAQAEAVAGLMFQLMALLEGSHDDAVLSRALDTAVTGGGPEGGTHQIILVVDRVDHDDAMARLLDSELRASRRHPRLSVILVARREVYDRWPEELRVRLEKQSFRECYVRRLWEQDLDLERELGRIMEIRDTGDEEQRRRLATWLAHLAYEAQGSIALALRRMKSGRDWTRQGGGLVLNPSAPFVRDREEIEHNAHVQKILGRSWPAVAGSLFNTAVRADQARIGVYLALSWIRDHPIFRRERLLEAAGELPVPVSYDRDVREATLGRLLAVLEREGYLRARGGGRYELCWRQESPGPAEAGVAADRLPPAPAPGLPDLWAGGDRPRQIALLVDRDDEELDALATQIAFEAVEAGWRLLVSDRHELEATIRERLSDCHSLCGDDRIPPSPVVVLACGSGVRTLSGEEVVSVATPDLWIEELLARADAVIFLRRNDRGDLARIRAELSGGAVPVIPVGAVGGLAEALWSELRSRRAGSSVSPEALAGLGPGVSSSVPEIARTAITLAGALDSRFGL